MFQERILSRFAKLAHPVGHGILCLATFCNIADLVHESSMRKGYPSLPDQFHFMDRFLSLEFTFLYRVFYGARPFMAQNYHGSS